MAIITQRNGKLEYLTAQGISVPHCFTTRLGGVSKAYLESLNLGANRGDSLENVKRNYAIISQTLGFAADSLVLTHQIHSDIVRVVTRQDHRGFDHRDYPPCDAVITNAAGTALVVFSADCTPILLHDPVAGAVGAVHAGWRGTAADIAGKTVRKMAAEFGCDPKNIRAAIGPNIGACCFQTDEEVPEALAETYGPGIRRFIRESEGKFYPDLKKINACALENAGVVQIELSTECTMCHSERFWSHRVHGTQRGSQGAIIFCKEANI